jgi:hypothetical protein
MECLREPNGWGEEKELAGNWGRAKATLSSSETSTSSTLRRATTYFEVDTGIGKASALLSDAFMKLLVLLAALALAQGVLAQGTTAQSGVSFEWVTVGDPGNPNDPLTGVPVGTSPPPVRGGVPYVYSISKYETTIGQYTAFLNAVAKSGVASVASPPAGDLGNGDKIRFHPRAGFHVTTLSIPPSTK